MGLGGLKEEEVGMVALLAEDNERDELDEEDVNEEVDEMCGDRWPLWGSIVGKVGDWVPCEELLELFQILSLKENSIFPK